MSTASRRALFGPDRIRPGYEDQEWAVWVTGMDDVIAMDALDTALAIAAEKNAIFAEVYDGSPFSPVTHALVLHHGYVWARVNEHREGRDCGVRACGKCVDLRVLGPVEGDTSAIICSRCKQDDGPFIDGLCEACAAPQPLSGGVA